MPTNDQRSKLMSTAEAESFGAVPAECKELLRGFMDSVIKRPCPEMTAYKCELTDEEKVRDFINL
jgi:hypothetical protein